MKLLSWDSSPEGTQIMDGWWGGHFWGLNPILAFGLASKASPNYWHLWGHFLGAHKPSFGSFELIWANDRHELEGFSMTFHRRCSEFFGSPPKQLIFGARIKASTCHSQVALPVANQRWQWEISMWECEWREHPLSMSDVQLDFPSPWISSWFSQQGKKKIHNHNYIVTLVKPSSGSCTCSYIRIFWCLYAPYISLYPHEMAANKLLKHNSLKFKYCFPNH